MCVSVFCVYFQQHLSNQSQVLITEVPFNNSGKFSCEVSADAPSFHTSIVSSEMEVVELPQVEQVIIGIHQRYRMGDTLRGNCTSDYSKPAANLTWIINDVPVSVLFLFTFNLFSLHFIPFYACNLIQSLSINTYELIFKRNSFVFILFKKYIKIRS